MSFAAGLRQALEIRQSDVASELKRGDSLEDILNRHLLAVEAMSDSEIEAELGSLLRNSISFEGAAER